MNVYATISAYLFNTNETVAILIFLIANMLVHITGMVVVIHHIVQVKADRAAPDWNIRMGESCSCQ